MNKQIAMVINLILDESSSMSYQRNQTISAVNEFLQEQKLKSREDVLFSLTKFNTHAKVIHNAVPIEEVPDLTPGTYMPSGGTALYDAIGQSIMAIEARIKDFEKVPAILCVVFTDGDENSSKEFGGPAGLDKIRALITEREEGEDWTFVYLGCAMDAWNQASNMGFSATSSDKYNSADMVGTMKSLSRRTANYSAAVRSGSVQNIRSKGFFSDENEGQQIDMSGDDGACSAEVEEVLDVLKHL